MNNKLVIIGNGFDLHADLKSSFSDFFENSERAKVEKWLQKQSTENQKDLSLISLLLYNSYFRKDYSYEDYDLRIYTVYFKTTFSKQFGLKDNLVDWMDVEGFLDSLLKSKAVEKLASTFDSVSKHQYNSDHICICQFDGIPLFISQCLMPRKYFSINSFYDFFLEELKLFEKSLTKYLKKELDEHLINYYRSSNKVFNKIISQGDSGTILNFNYTHVKNSCGFDEINIHGSLEGDIIIGIDDQEDLGLGAIQFTKTFRKLVGVEKAIVLKRQIDEIVIYGHSLGEQDYSYFQSIFDYAKIYSSSTIVRFIYSDDYVKDDEMNPGYTKNLHRIKMALKLFKLMRSYGATLDNKDNGQNLIHKMILEGRLKVELNNFDK